MKYVFYTTLFYCKNNLENEDGSHNFEAIFCQYLNLLLMFVENFNVLGVKKCTNVQGVLWVHLWYTESYLSTKMTKNMLFFNTFLCTFSVSIGLCATTKLSIGTSCIPWFKNIWSTGILFLCTKPYSSRKLSNKPCFWNNCNQVWNYYRKQFVYVDSIGSKWHRNAETNVFMFKFNKRSPRIYQSKSLYSFKCGKDVKQWVKLFELFSFIIFLNLWKVASSLLVYIYGCYLFYKP